MLLFSQMLRQGGRQRAIEGGPHHGKSKLRRPFPGKQCRTGGRKRLVVLAAGDSAGILTRAELGWRLAPELCSRARPGGAGPTCVARSTPTASTGPSLA